jgi:8-oxo-dGTP pyrophosphatase MutT (NUDIX family)
MAHLHEKIDFTVSVFVVHKDTVLVRKHEKYHLWLGVGGHIELAEDPNQAAVREVKEEVGVEVVLVGNPLHPTTGDGRYTQLIPPKYLNRHFVNDTHEHVDLIYFATSKSNIVVPENATDEWRWFTQEELEKNEQHLLEDVLIYAKTALKELGTK